LYRPKLRVNKSRFRSPKQALRKRFLFTAKITGRRKPMIKAFKLPQWLPKCIMEKAQRGKNTGEEVDLSMYPDRAGSRLKMIYWSLVAMMTSFIISLQPVFADDIWTRFTTIMKDIYGKLVGISTIVAVTAATVALLVRMISRNQRAVDEASSWIKRILVTWIILNTLGFIVSYLNPLVAGGQYTP